MVVKMMKWSPWPPSTAAVRRFQVKVKPMKLDGFVDLEDGDGFGMREKAIGIETRWRGGGGGGRKLGLDLVSFHRTPSSSRRRKDFSTERMVKNGESIEWDDEFENVCCFSMGSSGHNFAPWDVSFSLLYGESKAKMVVIGKVSLNIAEMGWKMESQVERKLPINLQVGGVATKATLSVLVSYVEIRDSQDSTGLVQNSTELKGLVGDRMENNRKEKKKQLSQEEVSLGESDESSTFDSEGTSETSSVTESGLSPSLETQLDRPVKRGGLFSWKRRRLSFRPARTNAEPLIKKTSDVNRVDLDPQLPGSLSVDSVNSGSSQKADSTEPTESNIIDESNTIDNWQAKELISRDGHTKLKANVFFASFDQRSDKAAGESACTALVAVIAHWLQSNQDAMPTRKDLDRLIIDGSSEWRKLCDDASYVNDFPDKHFDLETVLHAGLRPLVVSYKKSFIGFFGPEKFESFKGAMSFDQIWDEISSNIGEESEPRIYIVSWNDHFFVLKADADAYYIIDTLGERLFEGCNQAYILRFDDSALMHGKKEKERVDTKEMAGEETTNPKEETEEIICSGKECCREFIKRFLAAITLQELELEEEKEAVSYYSLHQRLQIEFNFSCSLSSSSSQFSSSATTSSSSLFSKEESFLLA